MKRCPDCDEFKELDAFPRNRSTRDGRGVYCKPCHNARTRETIKRLYGNTRHYHLRQRFGIGAADVDRMIEEQGGVCRCCGVRPAEHVDHDHKRNRVRAILCPSCNTGMGMFKDDPQIIERAIAYLEKARRRREEMPSAITPSPSEISGGGTAARRPTPSLTGTKVSIGTVQELLDAQGALCAICASPDPTHIDHDHVDAAIRGILCFGCNGGLGQFEDDVSRMRQAIDYLNHFMELADRPVHLCFEFPA